MPTKIPLPSTAATPFLTPRSSGAQVFHRRIVVPLPIPVASALRLSSTNGSVPSSPPPAPQTQPQAQEQQKVVVVPVAFVRIGALRSTAATPPAPAPARKVHGFPFHRTTYCFSARRPGDSAALPGEVTGAVGGLPNTASGLTAAMVTQRRCASTSKPSRQSSKRKSGNKKGSVLKTAQDDPRNKSRSGDVDFSDFDPFGGDIENGAAVHDTHNGEGAVEGAVVVGRGETVEASAPQVSWVGRDGIERTRTVSKCDLLHERLRAVLFEIRGTIRAIRALQKTTGRDTLCSRISDMVAERRVASAEFTRRLYEVRGEAEDEYSELARQGFLASGSALKNHQAHVSSIIRRRDDAEPGLAESFTPQLQTMAGAPGTAMAILGHNVEDEDDADELAAVRREAFAARRLQNATPALSSTRWAPLPSASTTPQEPDEANDVGVATTASCPGNGDIPVGEASTEPEHDHHERFRAAQMEYDAALAEVQRHLDTLRLLAGTDVVALVRAESLVPTAPILAASREVCDKADDQQALFVKSSDSDTVADDDESDDAAGTDSASSQYLQFCGTSHASRRLSELGGRVFFDLFFSVTARPLVAPPPAPGDEEDSALTTSIDGQSDPTQPCSEPSSMAFATWFRRPKPLRLTQPLQTSTDETVERSNAPRHAVIDEDESVSPRTNRKPPRPTLACPAPELKLISRETHESVAPVPDVVGEIADCGAAVTLLHAFLCAYGGPHASLYRRSIRLKAMSDELAKEERQLQLLRNQQRLVERMLRERAQVLAREDEEETNEVTEPDVVVEKPDTSIHPPVQGVSDQEASLRCKSNGNAKPKSPLLRAIEMDIRLQIASQTADDTGVWLEMQREKIRAQARLVHWWQAAVWRIDGQYSKSINYDAVLSLSQRNFQNLGQRARMLTYALKAARAGREFVSRTAVLQELGKCAATPLFDLRVLRLSKTAYDIREARDPSFFVVKQRGVARAIGGGRWSKPASATSETHPSHTTGDDCHATATAAPEVSCSDSTSEPTDTCPPVAVLPPGDGTSLVSDSGVPEETSVAEANMIAARSLRIRREKWKTMVALFRVLTTAVFAALATANDMSVTTLEEAVAAHIGVLRAAAPLCITGEQACTLLHLRSPRLRGFLLSHMTRLTHRSELCRKKSAAERIAARDEKEKERSAAAQNPTDDANSTSTPSNDSGYSASSVSTACEGQSTGEGEGAETVADDGDSTAMSTSTSTTNNDLRLDVVEASAVLPRLTPHEAITGLECIHRERLRFRFIEDKLYARYVESEKLKMARDDMAQTEQSKRRERLIAAANDGQQEADLSAAAASRPNTNSAADAEAALEKINARIASRTTTFTAVKWKTGYFATKCLGLTGIRHMHTVGTGLTTKAGKLLRVALKQRECAEALRDGKTTGHQNKPPSRWTRAANVTDLRDVDEASVVHPSVSNDCSTSSETRADHEVADEALSPFEHAEAETDLDLEADERQALEKYTPEQLMCLILSVCAATTAVSEARRLFARHMNDILPRMDPSDAARVARELIHTKGMAGFCAPYLIQHALADGNVQKLDPAAAAAAVEVITLMQQRSSKKEDESVTCREKDLPCILFPDVKVAEHRIAMRRLFLHCTHLTCGARGLTRDEAAVLCSSLFKARALAPWSAVLLARRTLCKALSHSAQATATSDEPGILNLRLAQMSKRHPGLSEENGNDVDGQRSYDVDDDEQRFEMDTSVDVHDNYAWQALQDVIAAERREDMTLRNRFEQEATLQSAVAAGWRPFNATGLTTRADQVRASALTAGSPPSTQVQPSTMVKSRWRRPSQRPANEHGSETEVTAKRAAPTVLLTTPQPSWLTRMGRKQRGKSKRALAFMRVSNRLRWQRDMRERETGDLRRRSSRHIKSERVLTRGSQPRGDAQRESQSPWPLSFPDLTPKHLQKAMFFKKPELCAAQDPVLVRAVCNRIHIISRRPGIPHAEHIDTVIDMLWVLARAVEIEKARAIKARVAADNAPRTFQNSSYRSNNDGVKDGMGRSGPDSAAAALLTKHSAALRLAVLEEHNGGFPITSLMGAGGDARPNRPFTPSSTSSSSNGEQVSATASLCGIPPSTNHSETGTGTYARRVRAHFQELDAEIASGGAISKATMAEYHQLVMAQAQYETDHLSSGEMTAQIVEVAPRIVPLLRKGLANITPYQAFVLCRVLPVLRVDDLSLGLALVHKAMSKRRRHTSMLLPPIDPAAEQEALATGASIVDDDDEDGNADDATVTNDGQVPSICETDGCDNEVATASVPIEDQAMRADEGRRDNSSMAATPSLSMPLPAAPRSGFYRAAARAADPSAASIPIAGPRRGEASMPVLSEHAELNDADGIHEPIVLKQPVQGELMVPSKKHDGSKTADPHHHQRSVEAEKDRQRALEAGLLPGDSHALPRHSLYDVAVMTHALVSFGARDDTLEGHLQEHALHAVGLEL